MRSSQFVAQMMMGMGERGSPIQKSGPGSGATLRCGVGALALLIGLVLLSPAARADVYAGFSPLAVTVAPGDTFTAYVAILQADASFNAFDLSVRFDPNQMTFVPTSPLADQRGIVMTSACSNTFHRFESAPDSLKATLSLLCSDTFVTGPGTIYLVRFRAGTTPGTTTISLGPFTEFYSAGLFVRPLHTSDLTVTIGSATGVGGDAKVGDRLQLAPPAPNPGHGSGALMLQFELPSRDLVRFDVLDAQGRRVAGKDAGWYEAGWHRVPWSLPALANGSYFLRLRAPSTGSAVQRWEVVR